MASKKRSKFSLDEETLDYYKNISAMFNDKSQEQSEKDVLIDNVLGQLEEEAVKVCQCPQTSPIVEDLIAVAPLPHLTKLFQILHKDWQVLCTSPAASHILERIITVLPKFISESVANKDVMSSVKNREDENVNDTVKLIRLLMDVSDLMLEDLESVFTHVYYSHVLRTLLQVLGGTRVGESLLKSRTSRERSKEVHSKEDFSFVQSKQDLSFTDFSVPSAFLKKLKHIAKSIFEMDNISKFLTDSNGSPVIQILLHVLHKCDFDLCQKYIHKVIQSSRIKDVGQVHDPESANLPPVAADSVGSFLIELILSLTSKETFNELYEELFQGRLFQFSIHPKANFVLQKLIKGCADKEMFEKLFDELSPHLEDILAANHLGVAVALAESCQKLGVKQGKFKNSLMQAFHCLEPEESQLMFVSCLLSFTTYELLSNGQDVSNMPLLNTFNYHGSMLLQQLLKFSKTKYIVKSFLSLRPAEFRNMAFDPCGSHVIEKFIVAEGIKEKHKDALLNKLKGCYVDLACHKNGSRTLEDIWKNLSAKQKALVATELCEKESKLLSDRFGRFVHRNFALNHFKKRRDDWMEIQGSEQRKRQMFREFLDSPSEMRPKKIFKQEAVSRKTWKREIKPNTV